MSQVVEHRVVDLSNTSIGNIFHLNYPQDLPYNFDLSQHFIAKLGDIISIELHGVQFSENQCSKDTNLEVIIIFEHIKLVSKLKFYLKIDF